MANKKYPVNWLLSHNKKDYEAGDSVSLSESEATRLLACGVISEPVATKKKSTSKADKAAAEKAEADKVAAEKAEADKVAAEKAEADKVAAEKAEADKVAAEKAEADKVAAEKAEGQE